MSPAVTQSTFRQAIVKIAGSGHKIVIVSLAAQGSIEKDTSPVPEVDERMTWKSIASR